MIAGANYRGTFITTVTRIFHGLLIKAGARIKARAAGTQRFFIEYFDDIAMDYSVIGNEEYYMEKLQNQMDSNNNIIKLHSPYPILLKLPNTPA